MFEYAILGIIQGITEWLPVSSKAILVLLQIKFGWHSTLDEMIRLALFLHMGTFLAALIYLRRDVWALVRGLAGKDDRLEIKKMIRFLITTTLISGVLGYGLLISAEHFSERFELTGRGLMICIGLLLFITAGMQLTSKGQAHKKPEDLTGTDGVILGFAQALSALPGLSRSGMTVSALLLRKFEDDTALRLSFLMSLPIVLAGNIVLNFSHLALSGPLLIGLFFSFIFGIATIHILLTVARRVNFGYFTLAFGLITIAAALI